MVWFEETVDKQKFKKKGKSARSKLPLSPSAKYAVKYTKSLTQGKKKKCAIAAALVAQI